MTNQANKAHQLTEVPNELYPAHRWLWEEENRDALRAFLSAHAIEIRLTTHLTFAQDWFEAVCRVEDDNGKLVMEGEGLASRFVVRIVRQPYAPGMKPTKIFRSGRPR